MWMAFWAVGTCSGISIKRWSDDEGSDGAIDLQHKVAVPRILRCAPVDFLPSRRL